MVRGGTVDKVCGDNGAPVVSGAAMLAAVEMPPGSRSSVPATELGLLPLADLRPELASRGPVELGRRVSTKVEMRFSRS